MMADEDPTGDEIEQLLEDARPSAWFRRRHPEVAEEFRVKAVSRLQEIARTDQNDPRLDQYFAAIGRWLFASQDPANGVLTLFGLVRPRGRPKQTGGEVIVRNAQLVLRVQQLKAEGKSESEAFQVIAHEAAGQDLSDWTGPDWDDMNQAERENTETDDAAPEKFRKRYQRALKSELVRAQCGMDQAPWAGDVGEEAGQDTNSDI